MRIYEYKMDANGAGNAIVPWWISRTVNGFFYNPANFTYIGERLADWVKVPDTALEMTKDSLMTRCKVAGVMMKNTGTPQEPVMVQMADAEIEEIVNAFCTTYSLS